jgi:hypothetical protein
MIAVPLDTATDVVTAATEHQTATRLQHSALVAVDAYDENTAAGLRLDAASHRPLAKTSLSGHDLVAVAQTLRL